MTLLDFTASFFFLQSQKLQYQAIAKHFYFPEQTTYKKNDINMPKMKNNEDDEDECKTASKVFFCKF